MIQEDVEIDEITEEEIAILEGKREEIKGDIHAKLALRMEDVVMRNSGLVICDQIIGHGGVVKHGSMVKVRYEVYVEGRSKAVDRGTLTFKVGSREVIAGWDSGVLGMKVGGKRLLAIPPSQAYGEEGAPPEIPGNVYLLSQIEALFIKAKR